MSPKEFKEKYNKEIIEAIKKKCQERNLICRELPEMQAVMFGVDPSKNKILTIENEAYRLHNDGNSVYWDFIGNVN